MALIHAVLAIMQKPGVEDSCPKGEDYWHGCEENRVAKITINPIPFYRSILLMFLYIMQPIF